MPLMEDINQAVRTGPAAEYSSPAQLPRGESIQFKALKYHAY